MLKASIAMRLKLDKAMNERNQALQSIKNMIEIQNILKIERNKLKQQCREAAQILIEEIGAPGPENVVETAKRAAAEIRHLRGIR
jgi:hypothetical protein